MCRCRGRKKGQVIPDPRSTKLYYSDETSEHNPGIFKEALFVNQRGLELHAYSACKVDDPRAVIIAQHGIRSHALYDLLHSATPGGRMKSLEGSLAEYYLEGGFAIYTYDCEGHGLSQSRACRGYFSDCWHLAADLVHFTLLVRKERRCLPVFVSAASLGGGISIGAAVLQPDVFDGLILAAPMVSVEHMKKNPANKCLVPLARLLKWCRCCRTARFVTMPRNPDDRAMKSWREDPLADSKRRLMIGPAAACMFYCMDLVNRIEDLSTPFLTMHAKNDPYTDYESSEIIMARAGTKDKTLADAPLGSQHHLFDDDVSRDWARQTAHDWLNSHCIAGVQC